MLTKATRYQAKLAKARHSKAIRTVEQGKAVTDKAAGCKAKAKAKNFKSKAEA